MDGQYIHLQIQQQKYIDCEQRSLMWLSNAGEIDLLQNELESLNNESNNMEFSYNLICKAQKDTLPGFLCGKDSFPNLSQMEYFKNSVLQFVVKK